jgi:phosphopantothenoylcysteine decarboxylase/phosphopantothenate--cysteine ligase
MYAHPAVRRNLETLRERGVTIIEPGEGELASGLEGRGRMEEPERVVAFLERFFTPRDMAGVKVLVTAGPTFERVDPARYLGNFSSGKMGYALASELTCRGAEVVLVSGPTCLSPDPPPARRVDVTSAAEMHEAATSLFPGMDVAVLCAAVADFTPSSPSAVKIKRGGEDLVLTLRPTRDIAAALGEMKRGGQRLVGFALETGDGIASAREKMRRKNLDMIVLNSLDDAGAGFQHDTNKVTILDREGGATARDLKPKRAVAADIVDKIKELIT